MGRRTRRYEAQFLTCLLVHGPIPDHNEKGFSAVELINYRNAVMVWWFDSHGSNTPPKESSQFRFWKRYRTWFKVHGRKNTNDDYCNSAT